MSVRIGSQITGAGQGRWVMRVNLKPGTVIGKPNLAIKEDNWAGNCQALTPPPSGYYNRFTCVDMPLLNQSGCSVEAGHELCPDGYRLALQVPGINRLCKAVKVETILDGFSGVVDDQCQVFEDDAQCAFVEQTCATTDAFSGNCTDLRAHITVAKL